MSLRRPIHRGFTLVEMMAAMGIGMVVLLLAVTMLRSTGDGYERLGGGIGAEREARAVLSQISSDLAGAQYHEDMSLVAGNDQWRTDAIGFLTLLPEDSQLEENRIGDLCAVRYYTRDEWIGGKTVRCLMRGVTESNETFQKLRDGSLESLFTAPASSEGSSETSNTDEAVASGVVSFEAAPKIRDQNGKLTDWSKESRQPPDVIVLKLIIARRELMGKLNNSSDWSGNGTLAANLMGNRTDAVRNKNFQVYETTIRFGHNDETK